MLRDVENERAKVAGRTEVAGATGRRLCVKGTRLTVAVLTVTVGRTRRANIFDLYGQWMSQNVLDEMRIGFVLYKN